MPDVTKALILAAGLGTRFLPATKAIPKELLPIGNYPTIHYLLQECKDSGISEVGIAVREWGSLTEKYFERDRDLEAYLEGKGKDDLLAKIQDPGLGLKLSFIKQDPSLPIGHGAPVLSARSFIDQDNFAFMFCDDLVVGEEPALGKVIKAWQANEGLAGVVMATPIPPEQIKSFSSVKYKDGELNDGVRLLADYIEKPKTMEEVFSYDCFIGRAVYTPQIIEYLERNLGSRRANDGEFSMWDAMRDLAQDLPFGVVPTPGKWLTTGNPEQMWEAQVAMHG